MEVRGRRECKECGTVWTYYETGSPACPDCDSLHSVGLDDPTEHTDRPTTLDLEPVRALIGSATDREVAERAASVGRAYVRERGFIDAGTLRPLTDTYVAARLLAAVGSAYARRSDPGEDEELYLLELVRGAEDDAGDALAPASVPPALAPAYGLALAAAVEDYQAAVRTLLADEDDPTASRTAGLLRDHRARIEALDGDVDPGQAHALLEAARDLGRYLRTGEESALGTARERLAGLAPDG